MTVLAQQPAPAPTRGPDAASQTVEAVIPPLSGRYIGYVLYFVGAGLISGAVVHHPLDPTRYTVIALIGAAVFVLATVVNEFLLVAHRPPLSRALRVVGASLVLSFGIGMLSGGLQHFEDFPIRGAVLVPLGLLVSFIGFVLRDAHTSWRRIFGPIGLVVALTAGAAHLSLDAVAHTMGDGGTHGHQQESPAQDDGVPTHGDSTEVENHDQPEKHDPAEHAGETAPEDGHGH